MNTKELKNDLLEDSGELEIVREDSDMSSVESDISLSERIVVESHEKRLKQRMTSLQNSLMSLKEQLKLEKELWKEDIEKIRSFQQQQEVKCMMCPHQSQSVLKCDSSTTTMEIITPKPKFDIPKNTSIKQLLELQNYKRKLAETENMCNLELNRVKQSLDDLKTLKTIAAEWGKNEGRGDADDKERSVSNESIQEIYINSKNES